MTDISVVIPSYNTCGLLSLALHSALRQTVAEYDIIVVDDCSTDGSVDIVERMQKEDSRLRILVHPKNRGISGARNTGIQNSKSKYITFLDSDDLFSPERIETLASRLEAGEGKAIVYSDWVKIDPADLLVRAEQSRGSFRPEGMIFPYLLTGGFRFTAGMMAVPRECFTKVGLYDESLRWAEDTDMALRLAGEFPFLFERTASYGWRNHETSSVRTSGDARRFRDEARVLENHIMRNVDDIDPATQRQAFNRLFGCYIGAGQWIRLVRMAFVRRQAFYSMVTIPQRFT